MHQIHLQHWAIGLSLAAVLHISAAWVLFRDAPVQTGTAATGLSIEIFSSGMQAVAASNEMENVETAIEPTTVETTDEPPVEVTEVASVEEEVTLPVEQEQPKELPADPVQEDEVPIDDVKPEEVVVDASQQQDVEVVEPPVVSIPIPRGVTTREVKVEEPKTEKVVTAKVATTAKPVKPDTPVASQPPASVNVATLDRNTVTKFTGASTATTQNATTTASSAAQNLAPIEQAGVDTENIRDSYFASISALLARAKRYPGRAQRRNLEGVVKLQVVIGRNGELVSFDIAESSSHRILDEEVERMVQRAAPFPAIPADIVGYTLAITVPIAFFLR